MQNGRSLKWFPCFQQRALSNPCKFVLKSVDSLTCEGIFKPTLRAAFARIQVFLSQSCVWFDVFASTGWWLTRTIQPGLVAYKLELTGTDFRFPCPGHGRPEKLPGTFYAISDLFSEWLWKHSRIFSKACLHHKKQNDKNINNIGNNNKEINSPELSEVYSLCISALL